MSILFNVWMLPILFILHDFEEMIFMPLWKTRHHQKLETFKKPFFGSVTQGSAFAVELLETVPIVFPNNTTREFQRYGYRSHQILFF